MDMTSIGAALRRQRAVVVVVFVLLAVATAAAVVLTKDRYTATTTLYVQPTTTGTTTSTVGDVAFLMPALEAVVSASSTRTEVEEGLPASAADADWSVDAEIDPGTGLLRVSVMSQDPSVPPVVADAYTPVLETYARDAANPVALTVIEPASAADSDRAVRITSIVVSGLLIASIAAVAVGLVLDVRRR